MGRIESSHSAIIEFRGDYKVIAALAAYYAAKGLKPSSCGWTRSQLMRQVVNDFYDNLLYTNKLKPVNSTEEAVEIMSSLGYDLLTAGSKGRAALTRRIANERLAETTDPAQDSNKFQESMDLLKEESNGSD